MNEDFESLIVELVEVEHDVAFNNGYNQGWLAGFRHALTIVRNGINEKEAELDQLLKGPNDEAKE